MRTRSNRPVVAACLALLAAAPTIATAQVNVRLQRALDQVENLLGETFGRSVPLPAASSGVSYAFDPATGNFQRNASTFGQIYLDRAEPIGAKRLNVSFVYQFVELAEIDGHDADDLSDTVPIPVRGKALALDLPHLAVDAAVHQFLFAATYGITDDLEVTAALPVMYSNIHVSARLRADAVLTTGEFRTFDFRVDDTTQPLGIGDVLLKAKYRVLDLRPVDVAAGLLLRLPSGDQKDLQGIGFVEVAPTLIVSSRLFEPASWARLQGHLNATVGFNADDVSSSEARWGIGLDWGMSERITAALAVLGRNQFARVAPPGFFDFPRCRGSLRECASDPTARQGVPSAPLFGFSSQRPDYYDVSIGGRGSIWRDTIFAYVNVVVPLNDGAVRTGPIPLLGVEATF